eukprot:scaffold5450_cov103-Skeletonema_dohrnii-CCMP3373.AAC.7
MSPPPRLMFAVREDHCIITHPNEDFLMMKANVGSYMRRNYCFLPFFAFLFSRHHSPRRPQNFNGRCEVPQKMVNLSTRAANWGNFGQHRHRSVLFSASYYFHDEPVPPLQPSNHNLPRL